MKHIKEYNTSVKAGKIIISKEVQSSDEIGGFPIYKGVLVTWDGNYDKIVFKIVDYIDEHYPGQLFFVCLEYNALELVWNGSTPKGFDNRELSVIAGHRLSVYNI